MSEQTPLIAEFFSLFASKADALRFLNEATGRDYKHNTIYTWSDPTKPNPQQDTYEIMVRHILKSKGYEEVYKLIRHTL